MSFTKSATMTVLGVWEDGQPINRTAAMQHCASYFAETQNTSKIDIAAMLLKVTGEYDISPNPKDYIFEAVRAVTVGTPNENGDAFHKNELLRYDHRLRQAVYQTFILKPHHVNHRADNPKTARGVILDAHYNDSMPASLSCPNEKCGSSTAGIEGRDSTGLYCRKCGSMAKDEFVEILIAVDKAKDPNFAEGVRTGVLNATSMGCVCDSTTCNVCDHVAYNRSEFCQHIRAGNKKKMFQTAAGNKMAFEWCNNVVFTEDSRVDQPADPLALQQEVLQLAARKEGMVHDQARETDLLIIQKQINDIHARLAQMAPPSPMTPEIPAGQPGVTADPGSIEQFVQEQDQKAEGAAPMTKEEMGILDAPAVSQDGGLGTKASIDQNILNELDGLAQRYASQHRSDDEGAKMDLKFRTAYQNVRAAITSRGNCRVYTPAGTLFVIQPPEKLATVEARKAFSTTVLAHIADHGLIPTIRAYEAAKGAKLAQILENHQEDFAKGRENGDTHGHTENGDNDREGDTRGTPPDSAIEPQESDRKDQVYENKTLNDSMLGGHQEDFEKGNRTDKKFPGSVQDDPAADRKQMHPKKNLSDSPLDKIQLDHQHKVAQLDNLKSSSSKPGVSKSHSVPASKDSRPSASRSSSKPAGEPKQSVSKPSKPTTSKPHPSNPSKASHPSKDNPSSRGGGDAPDADKSHHDMTHHDTPPPSMVATPPGAPALPTAGPAAPAAPMAPPAPMGGPPGAPPDMGAAPPMAPPAPSGEGLVQHWVAIEAMIGDLGRSAAGDPAVVELNGKAKLVAKMLHGMLQGSPEGAAPLEKMLSELEMKLTAMAQGGPAGMAMGKDALMLMDQMLAVGQPAPMAAPAAPAAPGMPAAPEGLPMTASKKGLPSFIKNKRGGSGDTEISRPSTSSKERANSEQMSKSASKSGSKSGSKSVPSKAGVISKHALLEKEAELKGLELRMERLYKGRIAKLQAEAEKREAGITAKLADKFKRALKLAARRQSLNLEESPIKAAFADVLLTPMDLGYGEYYPGMDEGLTVTLVERSAAIGMDDFIEKTVNRAADFMKLSDEAFGHIEADIKNLQTVMPAAAAPIVDMEHANHVRTAVRDGNLQLASAPSEAVRHDRTQLQAALGTTKIHRQHERTFNR